MDNFSGWCDSHCLEEIGSHRYERLLCREFIHGRKIRCRLSGRQFPYESQSDRRGHVEADCGFENEHLRTRIKKFNTVWNEKYFVIVIGYVSSTTAISWNSFILLLVDFWILILSLLPFAYKKSNFFNEVVHFCG